MTEGYYEDAVDVDGDGTKDDVEVTSNSDGSTTYLIDTDNDGTANYEVTDENSDGAFDASTDTVEYDSDADGTYDVGYGGEYGTGG
ncbi:MAG: hypothetical protein ACRDTQ_05160 [Micromonosporaceae bacterium]